MNRLFLRFLLMMMLAFLAGLMAVLFLTNQYTQSRWQTFSSQLLRGVLPSEAWPLTLDEQKTALLLRQGASVEQMASLSITPAQQQQLQSGQTLIDDQDRILYRLSEEGVLIVPLEESEDQLIQRLILPLFQLSSTSLAYQGQSSDQGKQPGSDKVTPLLEAIPLSTLSEEHRQRVLSGLVAYQEQASLLTFWWRVPDTQTVLQLGPIEAPLTERDNWLARGLAFLLFLLVFALCLWWWLRPLRRELNHLSQVVASFGQGNLEARVKPGRFAAIRNIANVFNQMAGQTQSSLRSQKELTYGVSHELRTPITRLNFMLEMAASADQQTDREKQFSAMRSSLGELEAMVSELLDYARMESASPALNYRQVQIADWLESILADHQLDCRDEVQMQLVTPEHEQSSPVSIDPLYLERALSNLLRNAIRHAQQVVRVSYVCSDNELTICVEDDGPGIPVDDRERVLTPFTRLDSHRNKNSGGHGLGLAIVSKIMTWHQGQVMIGVSEWGGAAVTLRCPISPHFDLDPSQ